LTSQIAGLTTAQVEALTTRIIARLSTAQLSSLTTTQVQALETRDLAVLSSTQLSNLTTDQIASLTTGQIGALNSANIAALTTSQVASFRTYHIAALTTANIKGLVSDQVRGLTTSQVQAFEVADLRVFMDANAFSTAQVAALGSSQVNALLSSPLALDLNGGGVRTLNVVTGVRFDIDGDGAIDRTGWVAPGEGLLARDLSGDGVINDGSELFGTATRLPDGSLAQEGFQALAALDTNADGRVGTSDSAFAELRVWLDADSDAVTDPGELKTMAEAGVRSIELNPRTISQFDEGNLIGLTSSFESTEGQTREIVDVWFRVSRSEELDRQASLLGDALRGFQPHDAEGTSVVDTPSAYVGLGTDSASAVPSLAPLQSAELARALLEYEQDRSARHSTLDEKAMGGLRSRERERRAESALGQGPDTGGSVLGSGGGAGDD